MCVGIELSYYIDGEYQSDGSYSDMACALLSDANCDDTEDPGYTYAATYDEDGTEYGVEIEYDCDAFSVIGGIIAVIILVPLCCIIICVASICWWVKRAASTASNVAVQLGK